MGGGGVPRGGPPSNVAYYIALTGIFSLLLLLCCYFCYFFIKKVKELSEQETPSTTPSSCRPARTASAYPVQPVVRDSATAMARLCRQLPVAAASGGKGDTVFPAATSPAPMSAHATVTEADTRTDTDPPAPVDPDLRDKILPPATTLTTIDTVR